MAARVATLRQRQQHAAALRHVLPQRGNLAGASRERQCTTRCNAVQRTSSVVKASRGQPNTTSAASFSRSSVSSSLCLQYRPRQAMVPRGRQADGIRLQLELGPQPAVQLLEAGAWVVRLALAGIELNAGRAWPARVGLSPATR